MSANELHNTCVIFLRKIRYVIYGTIAYSEGHNGGRAGPVDREDSQAKKFPSDTCTFRDLRVRFVWL